MRFTITTLLDLVGLLLFVAGLAVWAGLWFLPAGFCVLGAGVLVISWLLDRKARKERRS